MTTTDNEFTMTATERAEVIDRLKHLAALERTADARDNGRAWAMSEATPFELRALAEADETGDEFVAGALEVWHAVAADIDAATHAETSEWQAVADKIIDAANATGNAAGDA